MPSMEVVRSDLLANETEPQTLMPPSTTVEVLVSFSGNFPNGGWKSFGWSKSFHYQVKSKWNTEVRCGARFRIRWQVNLLCGVGHKKQWSSWFSKIIISTRGTLKNLLFHRIFLKFEGKKISSSGNPNGNCEENDMLNPDFWLLISWWVTRHMNWLKRCCLRKSMYANLLTRALYFESNMP
jgi:hypothetical protein